MADLPPGLTGYRAAVEDSQRKGALDLQNLSGLMALQSQLEMKPLQAEQLRLSLEQAKMNMARRQQLMGIGGQPQSIPQGNGYSPAVSQAFGLPPSPQGQVPQATGAYAGIPAEVMGDLVSNDPGLRAAATEALKIQAERQKPVVAREGAPVLERGPDGTLRPVFSAPKSQAGIQLQFGPQGQATASPVPGYTAAVTGLTDAEERAKAGYRLREVPVAGGGTRLMSEAQYLGVPQGQPSGSPVAVPGQTPLQIPPAEQARRDADATRIRQAELQPNGGGMIPSSRVLGVGQTPQQKAEQTETGQILGKQFEKVMGDAGTAAIANRYLDTMEGMAKDFTAGKLAPMQNNLTQWAQAFGLPISEEDKKAAGSIQGLTSMAIKLAGQATRQSDAQPSQLQYFKILESMPNAERTPEGFARIIGYMRDLNNISIIKAQEAQKWKQERGTMDGFEAQWPTMAKQLPFSWNTDKSITDAGKQQFNAQQIVDELRRRGAVK